MSRRISRFLTASGFVSLAALAIGGCPLEAPSADETMIGPAPGTYYVDEREEKLYYYQLAEVRGEENRWLELADDDAWFTGPGFYCLSENHTWSRDDDSAGLTLDEVVQLHDPPPAADEAQ